MIGFFKMVERAAVLIGNKKADQPKIMLSLTEEVGELAQEVKIAQGLRTGPHGKDGVVGEAIDVILCALDVIHTEVGHLDEQILIDVAEPKLLKWLKKTGNYDKLLFN
jgi:NTP pyrophosphatase (non-canonical NTP hydrolase)